MIAKWIVASAAFGLLAAQAGAEETPAPTTPKEKLSYSLGVSMGMSLKMGETDVDLDGIARGLKDAYTSQTLAMSETDVKSSIMAFQQQMMMKQQAMMQKQTEAQQSKGEDNKKAGEAFLAENKKKDGVKTLPSGLQYKVLKEGSGKKPTATDTVSCNYRGTLIDGTEFDSSAKHGGPAEFPVLGVIKGWTEALQLMPVGSKWQLVIPSDLAYGPRGAGGDIGPNATLIFEIELLAIK